MSNWWHSQRLKEPQDNYWKLLQQNTTENARFQKKIKSSSFLFLHARFQQLFLSYAEVFKNSSRSWHNLLAHIIFDVYLIVRSKNVRSNPFIKASWLNHHYAAYLIVDYDPPALFLQHFYSFNMRRFHSIPSTDLVNVFQIIRSR